MKILFFLTMVLFTNLASAAPGIRCVENQPMDSKLQSVIVGIFPETEENSFRYEKTEIHFDHPDQPIITILYGLICSLSEEQEFYNTINIRGKCTWGLPGNTVLKFLSGNRPNTIAILSRSYDELVPLGKTFSCESQ